MPEDGIPRCIILLVLILAGGFFAGCETAYSYCNKVRIHTLAEDGSRSAARADYIINRFDSALVTILIGNNVLHVAASTLATLLAVSLMGSAGTIVSTVVLTLLIFFFSETIPKNIAKVNADRFALAAALPLRFLMLLFTPISLFFTGVTNLLKKLFGKRDREPSMTGDEFQSMIETIEEEGGIEHEEGSIVRRAVGFAEIRAGDVMTRAPAIIALDIKASTAEAEKVLMAEKYSRLPVYDGDIDNIVGVLRTSSCLLSLKKSGELNISESLTPPYRVSASTRVDAVFEGMRRLRSHMAIVKGEHGATLGILTMEDILEEIVGDINEDETARAGGAK